jgi:NAD-dependent dihydropyrimidine dehydrogenase PreA subunit
LYLAVIENAALCRHRKMAQGLPLVLSGRLIMAYLITDTCTKDEHCIETCPVNCIHPTKDEADFATVPQLYVNPAECIDCGACVPVCPTGAIFVLEELPAEAQGFIAKNAAYFN